MVVVKTKKCMDGFECGLKQWNVTDRYGIMMIIEALKEFKLT